MTLSRYSVLTSTNALSAGMFISLWAGFLLQSDTEDRLHFHRQRLIRKPSSHVATMVFAHVTSFTHFIQICYEKCPRIILNNYNFQAVTHKQSPDYISQREFSMYVILHIRQRTLLLGSTEQFHFSGKLTYISVTSQMDFLT
jgi:hypothetical protein